MSKVKQRTELSFEFFEKAKQIMPGGVTANIKYFPPYPIIMNKGSGAYLTDVDGNEYVDYLLSYGSLMLGHGHSEIKESIYSQIEGSGTWLFGTPHQLEVDFGEIIKDYYPSIELLRYTNSGTEATLLALRFAAAHTGKYKVAKFEGHYHGGYDQVLLSVDPLVSEAGSFNNPLSVPSSKGIDPHQQQQTIMLPFNNENAFEILKEHRDEIGAVVLEPVQGGFIPAQQEFMNMLRKVTKELNMVLIFDEVKTGFRVNLGGAQAVYGIKPDLTALGKVIGGGFPMGVVGGKKEILLESSPISKDSKEKLNSGDVLFHSGTYNGHPMILAAGLTTMKILEKELDQVIKTTEVLKQELESLFFSKGIAMKAVGLGSMFNIVLTQDDILNYRDYQRSDLKTRKEIDTRLLDEGIYSKPLNRYSLSTCHGEKEIEKTLEAYKKVLSNL